MYPLFVPGRDQAVVAPVDAEQLKREDVVLYRRDESILILHASEVQGRSVLSGR